MEKREFLKRVETFFIEKQLVKRAMRKLLLDFQKEFPPRRYSKGYFLVGKMCGKTGCEDCPHSLRWRWYTRTRGKILRGKTWRKKLPSDFWSSDRKEEVKQRFKHYEQQAIFLNEEFELIQKASKQILDRMTNTRKALDKLTKKKAG